MFEEMLRRVRETVTEVLSHVELSLDQTEEEMFRRERQAMSELREDPALAIAEGDFDEEEYTIAPAPIQSRAAAAVIDPNEPSTWGKVSRNAPCPCGSGKKYKHCHGRVG